MGKEKDADHADRGHRHDHPDRDRIGDPERQDPPARTPRQEHLLARRARSEPAESEDEGEHPDVDRGSN